MIVLFSNLDSVNCYDDPKVAFCDANWVLMIEPAPEKLVWKEEI